MHRRAAILEGADQQKQTNEIGMAIPLLDGCDIAGKDVTADALLTQRGLARYVVERQAHYHFTVKANQPRLQREIALLLRSAASPISLNSPLPITVASRRGVFGAVRRSMPTSTFPTSVRCF